MSLPQCPILLVLVTGLPGAGKSTFLRALVQHHVGTGNSPVRLSSVFRLDDFISQGESDFSPARWRAASQQLYDSTERHVEGLVSRAFLHQEESKSWQTPQSADAAPQPIGLCLTCVVVEDNMHYKSMRERYWRLCQNKKAVLMLEARFTLPLKVCLRRNEERAGTSAYIPPTVIASMDKLFEHCLVSSPPELVSLPPLSLDSTAVNCWRLTPTTQPWTLLTLHASCAGGGVADASQWNANAICNAFCDFLGTPRLQESLTAQWGRLLSFWERKDAWREEGACYNAMSYEDMKHRCDLCLRACVRCWCTAVGSRITPQMQKQIQVLKKQYMLYFNELPTGCDLAEGIEDLATAFQEELLQLSKETT